MRGGSHGDGSPCHTTTRPHTWRRWNMAWILPTMLSRLPPCPFVWVECTPHMVCWEENRMAWLCTWMVRSPPRTVVVVVVVVPRFALHIPHKVFFLVRLSPFFKGWSAMSQSLLSKLDTRYSRQVCCSHVWSCILGSIDRGHFQIEIHRTTQLVIIIIIIKSLSSSLDHYILTWPSSLCWLPPHVGNHDI